MTCAEYLDALSVASWGAIPIHFIMAALAAFLGGYVFGRVKIRDKDKTLKGEREFFYKAGVVVCIIAAFVFIGQALARTHTAFFPEDYSTSVYYCADNPPAFIKKVK